MIEAGSGIGCGGDSGTARVVFTARIRSREHTSCLSPRNSVDDPSLRGALERDDRQVFSSAEVVDVLTVPKADPAAMDLLDTLNARHQQTATRLRELAASRSADSDTQEQVFSLLERWFVLGKPAAAGRNGGRHDAESETTQ